MESPSAPESPESTVLRELLFGLAGGGIAIGCLLPPLLHFITGPLGPFIGGLIATNLARPDSRGRTIIAVTVGTTVAAVCALTVVGIALFSSDKGPPSWFPDNDTVGMLILGIWAYSTALGAAGVAARSMLGSSSAQAEPE
jgi:hypothetical protein